MLFLFLLFFFLATLLVYHASFDIAVFAILRSDLELLTALWSWGSHIQDEADNEDDEKDGDDDESEDERLCLIHILSNHSSKSHKGHGHESGNN